MAESLLTRRSIRHLLFVSVCLLLVVSVAYLYQAVLLPAALAFLLYFLLAPLVEYFGKYRVPRSIVTVTILVVAIVVVSVISAYFVPIIYAEISSMLQSIPKAMVRIETHYIPQIRDYILSFGLVDEKQLDMFLAELKSAPRTVTQQFPRAAQRLWQSVVPGFFSTLVNLVLVPLIVFFMLNTSGGWREKIVQAIVPPDLLPHLNTATQNIGLTLRSVFRGQAIVASILALLYVVGLSIVGLKASIAVGLVAGICRIVPYFDIIVGGLLSLLMILADFSGGWQVLSVVLVFLVVQTIDGMVITPRVMGDKAGLHPLLVILSVISFGKLFGFWGVLFAIPAVAVAKVIAVQAVPLYQKSKIYNPS